jgi:hypothetical protein
MQVQNPTSNTDPLSQIDQQINQTIGKTDPQMAQALEQFLAQLMSGQNQSPGNTDGSNPPSTGGNNSTNQLGQDLSNLTNDLNNKAPQSQISQDIGNVIADAMQAMTMQSQGALPA